MIAFTTVHRVKLAQPGEPIFLILTLLMVGGTLGDVGRTS